jgi:septation ring formation regulator EzrA
MHQVTLRVEMLQQTAIFCEGKDSLAQLQQRLEKIEGQMQKQAEAMEAMVIGQESLDKTMESSLDGMAQQAEGMAQKARERKANMVDNFVALEEGIAQLARESKAVALDSKMGKLARGQLHAAERDIERLRVEGHTDNRQLRQIWTAASGTIWKRLRNWKSGRNLVSTLKRKASCSSRKYLIRQFGS